MLAFLSIVIIGLLGVALGGIFDIWVGGLVAGALLLLTYWLERPLDISLRIGPMPLAVLAPLVWGLTGGFLVMQYMQIQHVTVQQAPQAQVLQKDIEVTASLRSLQGKEVYSLKVEKDKVVYSLVLRYRKGLKPKVPKIAAHPTFHGPFIMPKPPKIQFFPAKDGIVVKRWELTLVPVLTGPLDTPRFVIRYRKKAKKGAKSKLLKVVVEPIAIEVSELGKPTQLLSTLRPSKATLLVQRPVDQRQILWMGSLGMGVLLLLGLGAWLRRRSADDAPEPPPHEWIELELADLHAQDLLAKGEFKPHYFGLSEIFRGFLERRYEFPALENTTEEIHQWAREHLDSKEVVRDIRQLLQWMDSVKFAGHEPEQDEQDDLERRLHSVLRRTRPTPEEERAKLEQEQQTPN